MPRRRRPPGARAERWGSRLVSWRGTARTSSTSAPPARPAPRGTPALDERGPRYADLSLRTPFRLVPTRSVELSTTTASANSTKHREDRGADDTPGGGGGGTQGVASWTTLISWTQAGAVYRRPRADDGGHRRRIQRALERPRPGRCRPDRGGVGRDLGAARRSAGRPGRGDDRGAGGGAACSADGSFTEGETRRVMFAGPRRPGVRRAVGCFASRARVRGCRGRPRTRRRRSGPSCRS